MSRIVRNPILAQISELMSGNEYGQIRGIIAKNGDVFVADAYTVLHDQIAREMGVETYTSFTLSDSYDGDDYAFGLDYPAAYHRLRFLHKVPINVATVGIVPPRLNSELAST